VNVYLSKEEAVAYANSEHHCYYIPIHGKQIMFEAVRNGEKLCMLTPKSKYHKAQDRYWVDITSIQADLMDSYDKALILFRLEGMKLVGVKWADIRPHLSADYMTHNANEGDHWKLQICRDRIWIGKQENNLPIEIVEG
jgi:hypothetical protein